MNNGGRGDRDMTAMFPNVMSGLLNFYKFWKI